MSLPLLLSVPHAGVEVPAEAEAHCILTPAQIAADGDEGAAEIYALADKVEGHITTHVARAIVDLNRAPDDFGPDGVVKTRTCWVIFHVFGCGCAAFKLFSICLILGLVQLMLVFD